MAEERQVVVAQILAMQRRIDLDDQERFTDSSTRDDYWNAITPRERELMLLRADSILLALDTLKAPSDGDSNG